MPFLWILRLKSFDSFESDFSSSFSTELEVDDSWFFFYFRNGSGMGIRDPVVDRFVS